MISWIEVCVGMLGSCVLVWLCTWLCVFCVCVWERERTCTSWREADGCDSDLRLGCAVVTKESKISAACDNNNSLFPFYDVCVHLGLTACSLLPLLSQTKTWSGGPHAGYAGLVLEGKKYGRNAMPPNVSAWGWRMSLPITFRWPRVLC